MEVELIPAKNHAQSFEQVIRDLQQAQSDYKYLQDGIAETIKLLRFLQNEVIAPPQWFVISHLVWVLSSKTKPILDERTKSD